MERSTLGCLGQQELIKTGFRGILENTRSSTPIHTHNPARRIWAFEVNLLVVEVNVIGLKICLDDTVWYG
jgi:hypothetical protein